MNECIFSVQLTGRVRESVHISLGKIFLKLAQRLTAHFLVDLRTEGAGGEEESGVGPSKTMAKRWHRSKEVTAVVSIVAL